MNESLIIKVDVDDFVGLGDDGVFLRDEEGILNGALNMYVARTANLAEVAMQAICYLLERNHPASTCESIMYLGQEFSTMTFRIMGVFNTKEK